MLQFVVPDRIRKLNRKRDWDYDCNGWYFVTFDCINRGEFFGKIVNNQMVLNRLGQKAVENWLKIVLIHKNVYVDEFVVMPDHIHGIIKIFGNKFMNVGTGQCPVRTMMKDNDPINTMMKNNYGLISKIVNGYKNSVTKMARNEFKLQNFGWQRSFFDEVIRNEKQYLNIKRYIKNNPKKYK